MARTDYRNIPYVKLRMRWNQVSYDPRSYESKLSNVEPGSNLGEGPNFTGFYIGNCLICLHNCFPSQNMHPHAYLTHWQRDHSFTSALVSIILPKPLNFKQSTEQLLKLKCWELRSGTLAWTWAFSISGSWTLASTLKQRRKTGLPLFFPTVMKPRLWEKWVRYLSLGTSRICDLLTLDSALMLIVVYNWTEGKYKWRIEVSNILALMREFFSWWFPVGHKTNSFKGQFRLSIVGGYTRHCAQVHGLRLTLVNQFRH